MKRRALQFAAVLTAILIAAWAWFEWLAKSSEMEWTRFVTTWEAKGERFDIASHLPTPLPPDKEFSAHPWIRRIGESDAKVLQTLDQMKPEHVDGYDEWDCDTDDNGIHRPMPPELARRVMAHAEAFRSELNGFAEAARRPNCRIIADGREMTGAMAWCNWVARLAPIHKLLEASAYADAALGVGPSLTRDLETLLHAGNLLRSSNLTIGVIEGAGFEAPAFQVLQAMPDVAVWPEGERRKWLAALDLRTRPIADEFAATSRLERGLLLKQLDLLAADKSAPLASGLNGYGPFRRKYLARARLAACEALQGMILSEGGQLCAVIDPERIARFQDHVRKLKETARPSKSRFHSAEEFGLLPQFAILGIQDGLIQLEADRTTARERISRSLP